MERLILVVGGSLHGSYLPYNDQQFMEYRLQGPIKHSLLNTFSGITQTSDFCAKMQLKIWRHGHHNIAYWECVAEGPVDSFTEHNCKPTNPARGKEEGWDLKYEK